MKRSRHRRRRVRRPECRKATGDAAGVSTSPSSIAKTIISFSRCSIRSRWRRSARRTSRCRFAVCSRPAATSACIKAEAQRVDSPDRSVVTDGGEYAYDYLLLACGAQHAYFGQEEWEQYAPGLKNLPQATEIRRRVLEAYEAAERESDAEARRRHLTFVVVGGGPTGVELAGAIGEMSRYTLARDFRSIDPRQSRVILVEAGPRILPAFDRKLAARAMRDLESLGVQTWTGARVTHIDADGVTVGSEQIAQRRCCGPPACAPPMIGRTLGVPARRGGARQRAGGSHDRRVIRKFLSLGDHVAMHGRGRASRSRRRARRHATGNPRCEDDQERTAGQSRAQPFRYRRSRSDGDDRPQPRNRRVRFAAARRAGSPGGSG